MNEEKQVTVPYAAYEYMLNKEDRQQKRMVVIIILLVVLLVASNLIWLIAWTRYDYVDGSTEVHVDSEGEGVANYIGNDGEISNGENNSNPETQSESSS